jgi:hypothetical protein
MRGFLFFISLLLFATTVIALEGKALYDYQVLFLDAYWGQSQWQHAIDSILNSDQWKLMDAQYGPYVPPAKKK